MKVSFIVNETQKVFEFKIAKPPQLQEYTLVLGENFIGYFSSLILLKKPSDANFAQRMSENINLGTLDSNDSGINSKQDLLEFEHIVNPKRLKKGFVGDVVSIISSVATVVRAGEKMLFDIANPSKPIMMLNGTFCWFKTSSRFDVRLYGGFEPFVMLLSIISSLN